MYIYSYASCIHLHLYVYIYIHICAVYLHTYIHTYLGSLVYSHVSEMYNNIPRTENLIHIDEAGPKVLANTDVAELVKACGSRWLSWFQEPKGRRWSICTNFWPWKIAGLSRAALSCEDWSWYSSRAGTKKEEPGKKQGALVDDGRGWASGSGFSIL